MMQFLLFLACLAAMFLFVRHLSSRAFVDKWQPRVRKLAPVGRYLREDYRALRHPTAARLRVPNDLSEL